LPGPCQEVFTHLDLPAVEALVALDQGLAEHWHRANARWSRIRALPGGVVEGQMRPLMHQIIDLDDADFEILLRTARWFTGNPRSGLTIRQVPVLGMGTKWLARNRRLVLACLNITGEPPAGEPDGELEQDDLDPLGLKALPVHVEAAPWKLMVPTRCGSASGSRQLSAF
jgi:hypothetical protein